MRFGAWIGAGLLGLGCGSTTVVSALPSGSAADVSKREPEASLEVDVDATSTRLPLAVSGANILFSDVDRELARSIEAAVASSPSRSTRTRHLVLSVELIEAHAEWAHGRLLVQMVTRATLRERSGNTYVAQTHARSSVSGSTDRDHGAGVVRECAETIASQLSRWLAGMSFD